MNVNIFEYILMLPIVEASLTTTVKFPHRSLYNPKFLEKLCEQKSSKFRSSVKYLTLQASLSKSPEANP